MVFLLKYSLLYLLMLRYPLRWLENSNINHCGVLFGIVRELRRGSPFLPRSVYAASPNQHASLRHSTGFPHACGIHCSEASVGGRCLLAETYAKVVRDGQSTSRDCPIRTRLGFYQCLYVCRTAGQAGLCNLPVQRVREISMPYEDEKDNVARCL